MKAEDWVDVMSYQERTNTSSFVTEINQKKNYLPKVPHNISVIVQ